MPESAPLGRQFRRSPLGQTIFQPPNAESFGSEQGDSLERQDAPGAPTRELPVQLSEWDIDSTREMSERKLVLRTNVEHLDVALLHARQEI